MKAKKRSLKLEEKKLGREHAYGICDWEKKKITLDPRQPSKERLNTLLHEGIHWFRKDFSEKEVIRLANGLTRLLWRDRWRRLHEYELVKRTPSS